MRKLLFGFLALTTVANAQTNLTLLGQLDYQALHGSNLANLWGYTDETGIEYALVGTEDGASVVDLSDPSNPTEIFFEPGSNSLWREVKSYGDYAYVTTEEDDGLMIIDLSPLPGSTSLPVTYFYGPSGNQFTSAHSLFIDENGILYLHGANRGNGGVIFYDLNSSPTNPTELGTYDTWYVHDSFARGDTLYAGHITDGFFTIVDVSDKANPVLLGIQNTPHNFTHNTWLSDDGDFLFTTDEVSGAFITAYDVTDPTDIKEVGRIQHDPGTGVIPHNTYYNNGYLVTSYYRSGVIIHDAQYPDMMVEVGNFDSSPFAGDGFNGDWGVYPYFPSGNIILSDMELGLFVLAPNYQRGCYLNGIVTDASNSQIISGVLIEILSTNLSVSTYNLGNYGTGILTPGNYDIRYSKAGYYTDTLFNVALSTNVITTEDVQLIPLPSFTFTGSVIDDVTLAGIPNAQVEIVNSLFTYTATTNASGNFSITPFYDGTYQVAAGAWGHVTNCSINGSFDALNNSATVALEKGYYDDFYFDFGWQVTGDAPRGIWVRGEPIGTTQGASEINPDVDVNIDCGDRAFITGNGGGGSGFDDVDSARTILTSPIFDLSTYTDPYLNYTRWFINKNGAGPPNDSLQFFLDNGITTVRIEFIKNGNLSQAIWQDTTLQISDFITPTANMKMIASISDIQANGGNLLEGGLDHFFITDGDLSAVNENESANRSISLFPNPNDGNFTLIAADELMSFELYDMTGRMVMQQKITGKNVQLNLGTTLENGFYQIVLFDVNGNSFAQKVIIRK